MKTNSDNIIRPTLHHFGLTTANLQGMKDWYAKVLGMTPNHETAAPDGTSAFPPMQALFVTNDAANHRIAIAALPGLTADPDRSKHPRLQHVAFELKTIDDLLQTYARLKAEGIKPVITADHGATTSFYYEDPDRNSVELTVDNFGDWAKSSEFMRTSPKFAANPMGAYVDPDKMIGAREAGTSPEELHRRTYAGEFAPAKPQDPRVLM